MILLTFNIVHPENIREDRSQYSEDELLIITVQNTNAILRILQNHDIKSTFFVEISIAESAADLLKKIVSNGHEVAFYSKGSSAREVESAKNFVEKTLEKPIRGFRQKEMGLSILELKAQEFTYLSLIEHADILFPFKRLQRKTDITEEHGISIIPESISPYLQLPYNDFVFQVMPMKYYQNMVFESVKNSAFVLIYLNASQFTDYQQFNLKVPFYRKYNSGKKMEDKLDAFLFFINNKELAASRVKDYII